MPDCQHLNSTCGVIDPVKDAVLAAQYFPCVSLAIFFVNGAKKWKLGQQLNAIKYFEADAFRRGNTVPGNVPDNGFEIRCSRLRLIYFVVHTVDLRLTSSWVIT